MAPSDTPTPRRPRRFSLTDINEILNRFRQLTKTQGLGVLAACEVIASERDRTRDVIYALVRRFQPNVDGAEAYLKSNALRLAMRVVRKANVEQSIDILSRSNMGVLAPKQEGGPGGGGFFLSVTADSCGAVVKVAAVEPGTLASLPTPINEGEAVQIDGTELEHGGSHLPSAPYSGASGGDETAEIESPRPSMTEPGVSHPHQGSFGRFSDPSYRMSKRHQEDIQRHKDKLTRLRREKSKEIALQTAKQVDV
jgi:hypothetical protein